MMGKYQMSPTRQQIIDKKLINCHKLAFIMKAIIDCN
jgi:hypothetical protein